MMASPIGIFQPLFGFNMTSTIDKTKPATGSMMLSAEVRNNFIAASNDIEALQANQHFKGVYSTLTALQTAVPTALAGDYAQVDAGVGVNLQTYSYDLQAGWVLSNSSGSGATNTDMLPEGATNVYFTNGRAIAALLTYFSAITGTITSADSIVTAIQKLAGNLALKLTANTAITAATKTKITYDANGLVLSGTDATTADISDSTNKRYVTDANLTVIGNTSGTNTGDETLSTIKTKLGVTTLSGSNTGDETLSSIKTKLAITTLSGDNTGDETTATIKTKLGISTLSGSNTGDQTLGGLGAEATANKDASGGYVGLTLLKINFKNAANTFLSFLTNSNTAARTYTFPDKDITVAGLSDIYALSIGKNKLINPNFSINQRLVSGTVTLTAGVYGHDRWKAGASGCTYTFASSNGITTLTISAGSLQQVIEAANVPIGSNPCCLSWIGTAQGKIGAGSYSASGVTATVAGGANLPIEFNTGTLSLVQFEKNTLATVFEQRDTYSELALCQYYHEVITIATAVQGVAAGVANSSTAIYVFLPYKQKRATPTITLSANWVVLNNTVNLAATLNSSFAGLSSANLILTVTGAVTNGGAILHSLTTGSNIVISAEL
jgi:hypothetical protein